MNKPKKAWLAGLAAIVALFAGIFAASCGENLPKVTLSFETNCEIVLDPVEAAVGKEVELPTIERGGWSFEGWYDNADFQGEALKSVVPDKDNSYYAKWAQMYLALFDTDGGTLPVDAAYFKEGVNLSQALTSYVPAKDGLTFAGWFYAESGEAVGTSDVMPAGSVSLLARYHVAYRAELYTKDLEGDGYTLETTVEGKDFVGENLTLEAPELPHFLFDETADNICERKLKLPAEENVFRFYYDRDYGFTVYYEANPPKGFSATGETPKQTPLYGASTVISECGFTVREHRFAGWSTDEDGTPEYAPGVRIEPTANMLLYAVWERGYTDRLGGSDLIFLPEAEPGVAILSRGGVECRGTFADGHAEFETGEGTEMTALLTPSTYSFAWENEAMAGTYHAYFGYYFPDTQSVGMVSDHETLELNDDMTAVYRYTDDGETIVLSGEIAAEKEGYSFLVGDTVRFTFRLGTLEDGSETRIFYTVGAEKGDYNRLYPEGDQLYVGTPYLRLDGMGGLVYDFDGNTPVKGYYHIDKQFSGGEVRGKLYTAVLRDEDGDQELSFMTYESGYEPYLLWYPRDESVCGEFTGDSGATLTLDGYGLFSDSAVYVAGSDRYSGSYTVEQFDVFGTYVTLYTANGDELTFRLTESAFEVSNAPEALDEMYRLVQSPDGAGIESVLFVPYRTAAGTGNLAEIYVIADRVAKRAATGYYTIKDLGGVELYTFTCTGEIENGLESYLFFQNTFTFLTNDRLSIGGDPITVYYVFEHDGEKSYTLYTEKDGDGQIWYNNFGISRLGSVYVKDGVAIEGSLSITGAGFYDNQNFATFSYAKGGENGTLYFLVETDGDANTYRVADFPSRTLVNYPVTGADSLDAYSSPYSLILDGVGGAIYAPGGDASVNDQSKLVKGVYAKTGVTEFGDPIYTYTPAENTLGVTAFEFTMGFHTDSYYGLDIIVGMYIYHKRDASGLYGSYSSSDGAIILDGFCDKARFTAADGTEYEGIYYYLGASGTAIRFYDEEAGAAFTLDFSEDNAFTVRDGIDGTYALYNDAYQKYESKNYTITLDGYGEAVLNLNGRETGRGTYSPTDISYVFRFEFELRAGGTVSYLIAFVSANGSVFGIVKNTSLSGSYLATNWTVLTLDGFGQGVLLDEFGVEHPGVYSLIGEGEGAFEYTDGTGGFRFSYDIDDGSFVYNSAYFNDPLVYYASDLSSVVYSGMLAIYNGVSYYFNLDGKDVTLFSEAGGEEIHTELPSGQTYQYGGKTYYRYTPGTELTFRNTDSEISVDLGLTFTPNGEYDYVAFEAEAVFGSATAGFSVSVGYGDNGEWQTYLLDLVNYNEYEIALHWDPNGTSTYAFASPIEERTEEYADSNEEGGLLTFYYYAIGSVMLQGRIVGVLNYGQDTNGDPFTFEADLSAMETVAVYETDIGNFNLSQILFRAKDGNLYAVRFSLGSITTDMEESETWYTLDSITICKEFRVSDESGLAYLVRTYQYVYMYPEYSDGYEAYELYDGDLYLDLTEEGEAPVYLTPRHYSLAPDGSAISWGVRFSDGSTIGFLISLTYGDDGLAASAAVTSTYYGQYADENEEFFVEVCYEYNLSLKQFDILGITILARWDEASQGWVQIEATFEQDEDGSWRAITEDGVYTITITLEEDMLSGYYALLHIQFTPNGQAEGAGTQPAVPKA